MANDDIIFEEEDTIRPFLVTSGRTRSKVRDLRLETMVERTNSDDSSLRFEAASVATLCATPMSLAEVSAHLKIPLGTAKVLVGDLIGEGHLRPHKTMDAAQSKDLNLIKRLIAGVRAL